MAKIETVGMEIVRMALEAKAELFAREIDGRLNQAGEEKMVGFVLIMFTFGEGGSLTWISNAQRIDMIKAMEEWIAKVKGVS